MTLTRPSTARKSGKPSDAKPPRLALPLSVTESESVSVSASVPDSDSDSNDDYFEVELTWSGVVQ